MQRVLGEHGVFPSEYNGMAYATYDEDHEHGHLKDQKGKDDTVIECHGDGFVSMVFLTLKRLDNVSVHLMVMVARMEHSIVRVRQGWNGPAGLTLCWIGTH